MFTFEGCSAYSQDFLASVDKGAYVRRSAYLRDLLLRYIYYIFLRVNIPNLFAIVNSGK